VCNAWSFGLPNGRHIRWVCHGRGDYVHELSFEPTVNAPMSALPKLKLPARCIARLANQEEVWIEFGKNTLKITSASRL
jgi:hypothetical protein